VRLTCSDDGVELVIADDGRGFDPGLVGPDHLGLGIMRERAEAIGARLEVQTGLGNGTRVVAKWSPAPPTATGGSADGAE
jgi:signal transduction histidine kinase